MSRSYQEELNYVERINDYSWRIKKGFVPNMNVNITQLTPNLLNIHIIYLKYIN